MKHGFSLLFSCVLIPGVLFAQESFHRNNIVVELGAAIPVGNTTNYLGAAPLVSVEYGWRFDRFFQADAGFQAAFGAPIIRMLR